MKKNYKNIESIQKEDLVVRDGISFFNEKPYTGFASQDSRYIGGHTFTHFIPYDKGIEQGLCIAYYKNSNQVYIEENYDKGKRNGKFKMWDEYGNQKEEGFYKDDKKEGVWQTWFDNNVLESKKIFEDDQIIESQVWYDNYQLQSVYKKQGLIENDEAKVNFHSWHKNGQLACESKIIKKSKLKIVKKWNNNGRLSEKGIVVNDDIKFKKERDFYDNGLIKEERNFAWGTRSDGWGGKFTGYIRNGAYKKWDRDGTLRLLITYKEDKQDGVFKIWYTNGRLKSEHNYNQGKLDDLSKDFDINGSLVREIEYKLGQKLVEKTMYSNYYKKVTFDSKTSYTGFPIDTVYIRYDGTLLPENEWPEENTVNDNNRYEQPSIDDLIAGDEQMQDWYNSNERN